jgi:acyl-CoA thioesterase-2
MGRAGGVAVNPGEAAGSRRRSGLSLIQGGAEPPSWTATSLERLTRALDLRPIGFRRYEVTAAEARWPSFPGALLVASAVVAAERSLPGVSVGHLSCSFGPSPRADLPVEVAMSEVHIGESCITGRLTFRQRLAVHGEATVLLRSCASEAPARRLGRSPRSAGSARSARSGLAATAPQVPSAASGAAHRHTAAIAEWDLRGVPAADEIRPTGDSQVWSRVPGVTSDGTLQRALLAYLSELLPINVARGMRYPSQPGEAGPSATVLSHAVTYGARFDLRDWLLATVQSAEPGEGYVHALATFRTTRGEAVATVSQAVAVSERGRPRFCAPPDTCGRPSGIVLSKPSYGG